MKKWQKIMLFTSIAIVGISYAFGSSKVKKYRDFFDKMSYKINKIKNVKISGGKLKFLLDILLQNNTTHEIDFSTFGLASLKNIVVTDKNGKTLGVVNREIDHFKIDNNGVFLLENIAFELPVLELLKTISNISFNDFSVEDIMQQFNFILNFELAKKTISYKIKNYETKNK